MYDFKIYGKDEETSTVLCVCSSLSLEETTARLNEERPTGIPPQWELSDGTFFDGTENPCACDDYPETHTHYLFIC